MAPSETYVARVTVEELVKSARNHADSALTNESLMLFGHGDGGGGPGVDQLERLKRFYNADSSSIDGIPRVAPGHPNDFYERVERDSGDKLVTWKGELYFELHRGTYTSQAFVKKANRECELQLRELEFLATAASVLAAKSDGKMNYTYPKKQFEEMWKKVLLNQFHDVLPGSSIEMVFDDARAIYNDVYKQLAELRVAADEALAGAIPAAAGAHEYSVVNTLTWPVSGVFKLPPSAIITGPHVQPAAKLPSLTSTGSDALNSLVSKTLSTNTGYVQFDSVPGMSVSSAASLPIDSVSDESVSIKQTASGSFVLRNKFVTVEFNKGGRLVNFIDNELSRELVARNADGKPQAGGANRFVMFDDVPIFWDAWDVEIYHLETAKDCPPASRISVYEKGPLVASLLVEYQLSPKSKLVQTISLTASSSRLDFHTLVDWNESRRMLKVEFPFDIHSDIATYESAYGYVQRPTHFNTSWDYARFEVCCHRFADLSEFGYGVSILNDSKYGFATHGNVMRLSLLRSPKAPDANCDMGTHEFRYAIYPHKGTFFESNVVEVAHEFNSPPRILPSTAASSASSSTTTDSSLDAGLSMFAVKGARNVVLDAVKLAEDSNDVVLRFYEAYGGKAFARIESQLFYTVRFKILYFYVWESELSLNYPQRLP
ncbi:hypothetical protein GQ42DRAFT_3435 [Ramicandelaber brevisporus]|nr:hypothetical protein GQ42DRAFT_3435 [Ramicandelaber brevisporus]